MTPYYADDAVTLYHGDCREVLRPTVDRVTWADVAVADPPYGETSLAWDRWPDRWVNAVTNVLPDTTSLWCFGSLRMFLEHRDDFARWRFAQDVVWEKPNGTMMAADRFKRVHEVVTHWYRGPWGDVHHDAPREAYHGPDRGVRERGSDRGAHLGKIRDRAYVDDGTRMLRSVLCVANLHKRSSHPTEKPVGMLDPLIRYSCPPGGTVLDPFAGSGSTLVAAKAAGRRAVGVEADERYCEVAAKRLAQGVLDFGEAS